MVKGISTKDLVRYRIDKKSRERTDILWMKDKMIGHKTRRSLKIKKRSIKKRSNSRRHQRGGTVPNSAYTNLFEAARKLEKEAAHLTKAVYEKEATAAQNAIRVNAGVVGLINNHILPLMKAANVPMGFRFQEAVDEHSK